MQHNDKRSRAYYATRAVVRVVVRVILVAVAVAACAEIVGMGIDRHLAGG